MRIDEAGIHIRQSDIGAYIDCAEEFRRLYWDETYVGAESDAALVGTALHALIAQELEHGFFGNMRDMIDFAAHFFQNQIVSFEQNNIPYNRESFKTDAKAIALLEGLVPDWVYSPERAMLVAQNPDERLVEWEFDVPLTTVLGKAVWLCGTSDLVLPNMNMVWDWKTAGRAYDLWEKQRWAIQPTVYLYAAHHEGLIQFDDRGLLPFEYKVFMRGGKDIREPETYGVVRSQGNFDWLEKIVTNMVTMQLKMGTDTEWPLNDHGWHCSPKWCPFFATCKGEHVSPRNNWT